MATRVARQAFCHWEPGAIGCADARRSFEVRDTVIKTSLSKEKRSVRDFARKEWPFGAVRLT